MDVLTGPGLVQAIASTIDRQDAATLAAIPAWVRMFEAAVASSLRIREMIKRATAATDDEFLALPDDFVELKSIQVSSPANFQRPLTYASDEDLETIRRAFPDGGTPTVFTILGDSIAFGPVPSEEIEIELTYYSAIPALDLTTPGSTNALLTRAPDLYLYGSLAHSAPFLQEDSRAEMFANIAAGRVQALNDEALRSVYSGSRLNIKSRTFG